MRSYENNVSSKSDYYLYTVSSGGKKLFFYPICLGYFYYEPGYYLKRNHYDSFLVILITKGSLHVTIPGSSFTASEGSVVLLDCYAPHQYETSDFCEASWMHFDGSMARSYYEQLISMYGNLILPRNEKTVLHTLEKACNIFRNSSTIHEASLSHYITTILTELLLSDSIQESVHHDNGSLSKTITFINESFSQQLSLKDLAAQASLSPFYFTRIFTKETGMTPHQYLIATRINSAKFLLKSTNFSIKEVGFRSGFTSESSFCTTFKKWETITPSEYRAMDSLE